MKVLAEGLGEYLTVDPDGHRQWVRDHKSRAMTDKRTTPADAVARLVQDGDYIVYDCDYLHRGPAALVREVIRQRKRDLWVGAKFTFVDLALLVAGGCVARADVGFFMAEPTLGRLIGTKDITLYEYSNVVMTNRLMAGAMGLPCIAVRSFGGTDGFKYSGAKLVTDPYTGKPITIVPALNPDVALIHVHQADVFGNARVFGTGIAHVEAALAARKVIISTEQLIDTEEIRRDPGKTAIPYYAVDAVVHAPFGAYPGEMQGYYASDMAHVAEVIEATMTASLSGYLDKWVYGVDDEQEMFDKLVDAKTLEDMRSRQTITEGYGASTNGPYR